MQRDTNKNFAEFMYQGIAIAKLARRFPMNDETDYESNFYESNFAASSEVDLENRIWNDPNSCSPEHYGILMYGFLHIADYNASLAHISNNRII